MGWLANIFSGPSATSRRGQALSSTHEAFSLPTSSPSFSTTAYGTPEPGSSASYTYPPSSPARGSYDYVPSPSTTRRQSSLLPLHNGQTLTPPQSAVSLDRTWARLRAWLSANYPELGDTLNYGITQQDLAEVELQLGIELPAAVRESYLLIDGQEPESAAGCSSGLFFGLTLLPLEDVLEEWRFWREVDDDPQTGANAKLRESMSSIPPGWVRREYSCRGWIPLVADKAGNYLGVDLSPGESGAIGQVIIFGRDIDTKVVLWRGDGPNGWATWLASFVEELENGEGFEFSGNKEESDDEDDVGYESYYYEGDGRGDAAGGSGVGGLRLTGEYRGWDVLHAWADKSLRRWHQAGLMPEDAPTKIPEKMGLGVLDLTEAPPETSGSGSVSTLRESTPVTTTTDGTLAAPKGTPTKKTRHTPGLSISKLPAPMPLAVPTEQDIFPSSPDEYSPAEDDVEAGVGRASFMEEVDRQQALTTMRSGQDASTPKSPPVAAPTPKQPLADITDLLHHETASPSPTPAPLIPVIAIDDHDDLSLVGEDSSVGSPVSSRVPETTTTAPDTPTNAATPAAAGTASSRTSEGSSSAESSVHSEEFEDVDATSLPEVDEMGRRTDVKEKST